MYAVIRTGGKQQKVKPGDIIEIEVLKTDGNDVTFQPVLVVDDDGNTIVGKDVEKATVTGKLLGEQKGDKVNVFKYKSKSGYSRRQGHRQLMTLLEISEVKLPARRGASKASGESDDEPSKARAKSGDAKSASGSDA